MAFQIVWTKRAMAGYDRIINYLIENWSEREIINFIAEADKLRDMILTKEGENNQLKEKITSLQEDIDTVSPPKR